MCRRREEHQPNLDHLSCGSVSGARMRRPPRHSSHLGPQEKAPANQPVGGWNAKRCLHADLQKSVVLAVCYDVINASVGAGAGALDTSPHAATCGFHRVSDLLTHVSAFHWHAPCCMMACTCTGALEVKDREMCRRQAAMMTCRSPRS